MVIDDETHQHSDHAHTVLNFLCQWRLLEHDINNDNEKKPYVQNTRRNDYSSWTFFALLTHSHSPNFHSNQEAVRRLGFKEDPERRRKLARKRKLLVGFVWLVCQYIYATPKIFDLSSSRRRYVGLLFTNEERAKVGLGWNMHLFRTCWASLCMTSHAQNSRLKMAALVIVFLCLSNVDLTSFERIYFLFFINEHKIMDRKTDVRIFIFHFFAINPWCLFAWGLL